MTFTLFFDDQGEIVRRLLQVYFPSRRTVKIIDVTYGRGALWSTVFGDPAMRRKYHVTKCDAIPTVKGVKRRDLLTDDYSRLGQHDAALYDPPYLIGRQSFDYGRKQTSQKSWAKTGGLKKHTSNQTLEQFNRRVECLRDKAQSFLRPGGLLIVKVLDPRYKHRLICHHINIANALRASFELIDIGVYVRQGASTWKINGNLHNAHGYWLMFRLRDEATKTSNFAPPLL